jgi:hypothetical protein
MASPLSIQFGVKSNKYVKRDSRGMWIGKQFAVRCGRLLNPLQKTGNTAVARQPGVDTITCNSPVASPRMTQFSRHHISATSETGGSIDEIVQPIRPGTGVRTAQHQAG